jgi:hypothetical protein
MGVPGGVVCDAIALLWEDGILARSEQRSRRPTLEELDRILTLAARNKRQKLPLVILVAFAIFSARRLSEICGLRWEDVDFERKTVLVRDMKHPRKKKGNDVRCSLTDEAMAIIEAMPRTGEFIFPYDANSVGTAFHRHVQKAKIEDLHFHDLRHEGISRLFEMGWSAAFVAKVSGHRTSAMLDRYEHVKTPGDKLAGWGWLPRAIAGAPLHNSGVTKDSTGESSVKAGVHVQADTSGVQDHKLADLKRKTKAPQRADHLVRTRNELGERADGRAWTPSELKRRGSPELPESEGAGQRRASADHGDRRKPAWAARPGLRRPRLQPAPPPPEDPRREHPLPRLERPATTADRHNRDQGRGRGRAERT